MAGKLLSLEEVRKRFEIHGWALLDTEYKGVEVPLKARCPCGNITQRRLHDMGKRKRCKLCTNRSKAAALRLPFEEVKKAFEDHGFILLETEYKNSKTPMSCICRCGETTLKTYDSIREGQLCVACGYEYRSHPFYNPDISEEDRELLRRIPEYSAWVRSVKERDGHTCKICRSTHEIVAHHIFSYNKYPELRTDVKNGVTLCSKCHVEFHSLYGFGNNTEEQFYEFREMKRRRLSIAKSGTKRYLGLDLSTKPGIAVLEIRNKKPKLITTKALNATPSFTDGQRFSYLEAFAVSVAYDYGPFDGIIRESFTSGRSKRVNQMVFGVWAAVDVGLNRLGMEVSDEINAASVKRLVGGHGRADKSEVAAGVRRLLRLEEGYAFSTDDESDACAIILAWLIEKGEIDG